MEIRDAHEQINLFNGKKAVRIKLREAEDDAYCFYCYPKKVIENTLRVIEKSSIDLDYLSADDHRISALPLKESAYSVEEYDESEVYVVQCKIKPEELCELIEYVNSHPEEEIKLALYANSELPEFKQLLDPKVEQNMQPEIAEALKQYMKYLLDLSYSERYKKIMEYEEESSFGKLLRLYAGQVQEFILNNVTKRTEIELRKAMQE